ncbi:nuclear transport factor 2 family protein [Maribacter sp. 2210JD10-5]|uniref:nuclear transport factor 2 family protein n=1 Tax=Maribacter sp. 2210JD10-5 TaxID=3386272 RepID=UPI0039BC3230
MNKLSKLIFAFLFILSSAIAQQNTEVYLIDISKENDTIIFGKPINISNNKGYDNQPSFYDDNTILFSSTRNDQTDIRKYDIPTGTTSWLTDTPDGSEYSPLRIPDSKGISAIRLDTDGLQRLYQYNSETGKPTEILKDLKVGYHVWYTKDIIVSSVLVDNRMDLVVSNLKDGTNYTVQKNAGRSLHKIPNSDLISYISKENETWEIKSLHPITGETKTINYIWNKQEDIYWVSPTTIISPNEKAVVKVEADTSSIWEPFWQFDKATIHRPSRISVSPNGKYLAIVSEELPDKIVQKQVEAYNAGNLDAFVNCYSENVYVGVFPNDTWYIGHDKMRENYSGLSPENKTYDVKVVNRITIGNKVIDNEKVMKNGIFQQMQVAIYEVENDVIMSMRFIFDKGVPNPKTVVQQQLDAYNTRDIEGFLDTYADAISLYNFPDKKRSQGKIQMREGYSKFFEATPDLHCELKNRIVIGNKVIDQERVTANGNTFSAVAIYEVNDGKIARVTFVR